MPSKQFKIKKFKNTTKFLSSYLGKEQGGNTYLLLIVL